MSWDLRSKEEIQNVLQASYTATMEIAKRIPSSPELEAYLDGYAAALAVTAQGLGVKIQIDRLQRPEPRSWDEQGHLLPASLLAEDGVFDSADDAN